MTKTQHKVEQIDCSVIDLLNQIQMDCFDQDMDTNYNNYATTNFQQTNYVSPRPKATFLDNYHSASSLDEYPRMRTESSPLYCESPSLREIEMDALRSASPNIDFYPIQEHSRPTFSDRQHMYSPLSEPSSPPSSLFMEGFRSGIMDMDFGSQQLPSFKQSYMSTPPMQQYNGVNGHPMRLYSPKPVSLSPEQSLSFVDNFSPPISPLMHTLQSSQLHHANQQHQHQHLGPIRLASPIGRSASPIGRSASPIGRSASPIKRVSSPGLKKIEPQFKCPCGKSFKKLHTLELHAKLHQSDRDFACDICFKRFLRPHDLKRHQITHIQGHKPFECGNCGITFTRQDAMQRHLNTKKCLTKKIN